LRRGECIHSEWRISHIEELLLSFFFSLPFMMMMIWLQPYATTPVVNSKVKFIPSLFCSSGDPCLFREEQPVFFLNARKNKKSPFLLP
jgi:hypothetical protein